MKKKDTEEDCLTLGRERMQLMFDRFDHVAVMFSGGKDSTVVLQLALEEHERLGLTEPLDVVHFDEEAVAPETEAYVRRVAQNPRVRMRWLCWPLKHRNACSRRHPHWLTWDPDARDKWCRPAPPEGDFAAPDAWMRNPKLPQDTHDHIWPESYGTVGLALGIRAQESLRRYRSVTFRVHENWIANDGDARKGIYQCKPVYDWRTEDVWTAPAAFGWDYNRCTPRETPIWMGDFSFKPISEVRVGDKVIGWGRADGARDELVRATVTASRQIGTEPIIRIVTESGRQLRCTADHLWSTKNGTANSAYEWNEARVGLELAHIIDPVERSGVRAAAWLAGVYDGEACGDRIYQSPAHNPDVYAAIHDALRGLDIPFTELNGNSPAQFGFRVTGGRHGLAKLINTIDPIRRVTRWTDDIILGGRFRRPDRIASIRPDGVEPVFALTTTTGNYVAWGFASKNSYDLMSNLGLSPFQQRVAPPFGEEPVQNLYMWSLLWPELWERMLARVPGARTAARYSRSPLYGHGERPDSPPDGMTWREFVLIELDRWGDKEKRAIAERIREEIATHNRRTGNAPIEDRITPGMLSWQFLYQIARRGDLKRRKGIDKKPVAPAP